MFPFALCQSTSMHLLTFRNAAAHFPYRDQNVDLDAEVEKPPLHHVPSQPVDLQDDDASLRELVETTPDMHTALSGYSH